MAACRYRSRDVYSDPVPEQYGSGGTLRPSLPRPDKGDDVHPVPLWEREFCRNAYDIPWETFCENKRFIEILFKSVMDWDDSGAYNNFMDTKERFRGRYFGNPYEDPVLDPDTYIDKIDHHCKVDPKLIADLDEIASIDLVADLTPAMSLGEAIGNLIPPAGWGEPDPNLKPTGWGEPEAANPTLPAAACGETTLPEEVGEAHPYCTQSNNSDYDLHGGGGRGNQWNQAEGQQKRRSAGGMQRHQDEGRHQMRRGGQQHSSRARTRATEEGRWSGVR